MVVARELLGKYLVRRLGGTRLIGRIVEVEAYLGSRDPASHTYRGKTKRNAVMFNEGGFLYVYFTYGMHFCCNVVTELEGVGNAVLIRAVEPVAGIGVMARLRGTARHGVSGRSRKSAQTLAREDLCSGPGKVCQAFSIGRADNGTDLKGDRIWLGSTTTDPPSFRIGVSTRIGISLGKEHRRRFYIKGSGFVSRGEPVT
jgi:DNA-3-methyladenine glycosylase